jgi:hypothetical protein
MANSAASRALRPTFVILMGADKTHLAEDVPQFIPQSEDPPGIVTEILAACAATRA